MSLFDYDLDEECGNCGEIFGEHSGLQCPSMSSFGGAPIGFRKYSHKDCRERNWYMACYCARETGHTGQHFYKDTYWGENVEKVVKELAKPIGPRKPVPALPVEVFHTKEFNAEEAWAAIVALSKGS